MVFGHVCKPRPVLRHPHPLREPTSDLKANDSGENQDVPVNLQTFGPEPSCKLTISVSNSPLVLKL
jgi:hypothetical protein